MNDPPTDQLAVDPTAAAIARARDYGLHLAPAQVQAALAAAVATLNAGHPPLLAVNAAGAVLYPVAGRTAEQTPQTVSVATINVLLAVPPEAFEALSP